MGTWTLAVAPVMGTVPSNMTPPSKKEYVKVTALEWVGEMR